MSELETLINRVHKQARYISGASPIGSPIYCFAASLAAMHKVTATLSSAIWGYDSKQEGFLPPTTTEEALLAGAGICGTQTVAFMDIMHALNIPTRDIQLYWLEPNNEVTNNHIFPEIFWDNKWRMFDVTFGWHPHTPGDQTDVLGYEDIRNASGSYEKATAYTLPWTFHYTRFIDIYECYDVPLLAHLINGEGTITPPLDTIDADTLEWRLTSLPTAIGMTAAHNGEQTPLDYRLALPGGEWDITIETRADGHAMGKGPQLIAGSDAGHVHLSQTSPAEWQAQRIKGDITLSIDTSHNTKNWYKHLTHIRAKRRA